MLLGFIRLRAAQAGWQRLSKVSNSQELEKEQKMLSGALLVPNPKAERALKEKAGSSGRANWCDPPCAGPKH